MSHYYGERPYTGDMSDDNWWYESRPGRGCRRMTSIILYACVWLGCLERRKWRRAIMESWPSPSKFSPGGSSHRPRVTTPMGGRRVVRGVTAPTPRTLRRGPAGSFQVQAARAAIADGCETNTTTPGRETQQ